MDNLIEALFIFKKYIGDKTYPTWCEHDALHICCDEDVSEEDINRLDMLGFIADEDGGFISFHYGSC